MSSTDDKPKAGWEFDPQHQPHSMGDDCPTCDTLPGRRDVEAIQRREGLR